MLDRPPSVAVLLAGGEGSRLHEIGALEAKPALPIAGRRLVDFAVAGAVKAGIGRLLVALRHRPETLAFHLREHWADRVDLGLRYGLRQDVQDTTTALARILEGEEAREVLVLPADQVHSFDLRALLAAHRTSGAPATLASFGQPPGTPAPCVLDWPALREAVAFSAADLWSDIVPDLAAQGQIATWSVPEKGYLRDVDSLDDLRAVILDFERGTPCALPPGEQAGPLEDDDGRALAFEVAGLRLSAPRFGARQRGRWTLLEDTAVLPGARVASGARLSRAVVAPGAIVPANLVVGEDPGEDARWFRVTPQGTTLITAPMLAARAANLMRAQFGGRLPGLVTPKAR
jgi:glucose-1-phosphate adenylyltransferase